MRRGTIVLLACAVVAAGRPPPARAHAFLAHAEPRVGSTVKGSPPILSLFFTEPVEAAFSRIEVADEHGAKIATGALEHPAPDRLTVALPALAPGDYTVHWAVVSVDTHPTDGSFDFSVNAP